MNIYGFLLNGVPFTSEMKFSRWFAFKLQFKPFIHAATINESGKFYLGLTDFFAANNIIISAVKQNVISEILHININKLIYPFRMFTLVLANCRYPLLIPSHYRDVGVHFAKKLCVVGEFALD